MPVQIPLTQGQVATVCDCHAHLVIGRNWYAYWHPHSHAFYAMRNTNVAERKSGMTHVVHMHAVINNTPKGFDTDHIDGNTLNNTCANLRSATKAQNQHNQGNRRSNTSGYKGVSRNKKANNWRADIRVNGKAKFVGYFDSAEKAARAYDAVALELRGDFAYLNFP